MSEHKVMLAMPHNGMVCYGAAQGLFRASSKHDVAIQNHGSSLLAHCFNILLCNALNLASEGKLTHLAFLHADIAPADEWIDVIIAEMDRLASRFMSVLVPIKDVRGLTSTGIGIPGLTWTPFKRFTMSEAMELPETFSIRDTEFPDHVLLHNSGCWIADLRADEFFRKNEAGEGKAYFQIRDRIVCRGGTWRAEVEPEDWFFSRCLHDLGVASHVTRKASVTHYGPFGFVNDTPWGAWKSDCDTEHLWRARA